MHKPVQFKDLALLLPHKTCFSEFSGQIFYGDRIAIMGRNGSGKSSLLKIIQENHGQYEGIVFLPDDIRIGYVPQIVEGDASGGERFQQQLTRILREDPNFLLLDEPTNHLDSSNRRALMNWLKLYRGTLIVVTHDVELLENTIDILWHIHQEKIAIFNGNYRDYQHLLAQKTASLEQTILDLKKEKKDMHQARMREQERNKNRRLRGEKHISERKWPTVRSAVNLGSAAITGDKRIAHIREKKAHLSEELSLLLPGKIIVPTFRVVSEKHQKINLSVEDGSIAFQGKKPILQAIHFSIHARERVAICGDNGSGKSTFVRALLSNSAIEKTGVWNVPSFVQIGYLDQHYDNLRSDKTALDMVSSCMPKATMPEVRKHLNDFLFRKNEEVTLPIQHLSGGEKARLSLCCIAAYTPGLLILDEITNNLDLETRNHVIEVLKNYPGALCVISHDSHFLKSIHIETVWHIHQGSLSRSF